MDGLISWVKGIVCYSILTAVFMEVLPEKFRKYIRLYMGLLFLLLFLSPVVKLFHLEDMMEDFFYKENLKIELEDKSFELELKEADAVEALKEEYTGRLKEELEVFLGERGYVLSEIAMDWTEDTEAENFGEVTAVTLLVKPVQGREKGEINIDRVQVEVFAGQEDSMQEKALKNELVSFYNVDEANINVSIQGGGK